MPSDAQRVDQRPELLAHLRIEPDGRLVEQDEPRTVDERPGDQQAPPHAAGELVDPRVAPVDELRHLERALDRLAPLGAADPVEVREDEQVLLDGQRRVEVVELRRDAALGARHLRLLGQPEAEHLELALVGDRLRGQEPHRGRLAGAVRPEQADAGSHRDVEVEPVDRGDRPVALDDAAQADGELRLRRAVRIVRLCRRSFDGHHAKDRRPRRNSSTGGIAGRSSRPSRHELKGGRDESEDLAAPGTTRDGIARRSSRRCRGRRGARCRTRAARTGRGARRR